MDYELEQHLRELGILSADTFGELSEPARDLSYLNKDHYIDPRDPVTGEVPF